MNHVYAMVMLKEDGNESAHDGRPLMGVKEWEELMVGMLDRKNIPNGEEIVGDLVRLFEKYGSNQHLVSG